MSEARVLDRNFSASNGSAAQVGYSKTITQESIISVSKSIPDSTTDMEITFDVPYSQLKAIFIGTDGDLTMEVNHPGGTSTAADQTFTFAADQPLVWADGDPLDNPITQDIDKLYVSNSSGAAVQLEIRAMLDASP